jgi:LAO/AO transport system kinase
VSAAAGRRGPSLDELQAGVRAGDRGVLARAITLIESNAPHHLDDAQALLGALLPDAGGALRVGVTGVPGAGKSTLIETLGTFLTERGHRVAVTAVDPSSSRSGGSILGDKTRMGRLATDPLAFVRPSPSGGALGGVARKTRETIVLFEAAGYDVVLVETIGVGQSEIAVRSLVDFFLLVLVAGAGDELQAIKRGVGELADAVLVNKADGDGEHRAHRVRGEYEQALRYLSPASEGWETPALAASALTGAGVEELWTCVERFRERGLETGSFQRRRREQGREWLHAIVEGELRDRFLARPEVRRRLPELEARVVRGELTATTAARELLALRGPGSEQES